MSERLRLIAFDVDGVVVTPRDGRAWWTHLERDLGLRKSDLAEHFFRPYWAQIVTGHRPMRPALDKALATFGGPSAEDLIAYWFHHDGALNQSLLDAIAQIDRHQTRLVLATNQEPLRAAYLWQDMNLHQHFDAIYHSGTIGVAKPDAGFFDHITCIENLTPGEIGFLDDSAANCAAAEHAGWRAAHIPTPAQALTALRQMGQDV